MLIKFNDEFEDKRFVEWDGDYIFGNNSYRGTRLGLKDTNHTIDCISNELIETTQEDIYLRDENLDEFIKFFKTRKNVGCLEIIKDYNHFSNLFLKMKKNCFTLNKQFNLVIPDIICKEFNKNYDLILYYNNESWDISLYFIKNAEGILNELL